MFDNDRYITRGIKEKINIQIQNEMWNLLYALKQKKNFQIDYLQVFELNPVKNSSYFNQEMIHSQEVPYYKNVILFSTKEAVTAKIFVIDDKDHSTMMLADEY